MVELKVFGVQLVRLRVVDFPKTTDNGGAFCTMDIEIEGRDPGTNAEVRTKITAFMDPKYAERCRALAAVDAVIPIQDTAKIANPSTVLDPQ